MMWFNRPGIVIKSFFKATQKKKDQHIYIYWPYNLITY